MGLFDNFKGKLPRHQELEEFYLAAVKKDWRSLRNITNQTPKICLTAVQQNSSALRFVNRQTPELCMAAVCHDGYSLKHVDMVISTNEIGIKVFGRSTILKYIFFVKLDSLVEKCSILKYEKCDNKDKWFKPRMMILQNISGTLRGADLIPVGNNGDILPLHIPSIDSKELSLYRVNFLNNLFKDCTLYQLRGGLREITEFIKSVLDEEWK